MPAKKSTRKKHANAEMTELLFQGCRKEDCLFLDGRSGPLSREELFINDLRHLSNAL